MLKPNTPATITLTLRVISLISIVEKLLSLLRANPCDVTLVFCNTVSSCDWTAHFLQDRGVPVVKLHAGFSPMVCETDMMSHGVML